MTYLAKALKPLFLAVSARHIPTFSRCLHLRLLLWWFLNFNDITVVPNHLPSLPLPLALPGCLPLPGRSLSSFLRRPCLRGDNNLLSRRGSEDAKAAAEGRLREGPGRLREGRGGLRWGRAWPQLMCCAARCTRAQFQSRGGKRSASGRETGSGR